MTRRRALVLGGGGTAGLAWLTGVLAELAGRGVDVSGADAVIGTSAGAMMAAQLGRSLSLADLLARQLGPALAPAEVSPGARDMAGLWQAVEQAIAGVDDPAERHRRVGAFALQAETIPEAGRRASIAARLPDHSWPGDGLRITAVDAHTGEFVVFDRASGVGLVDAVAASCAVPGIWPPVTIGGARYIDGGVRSGTSADLAAGYDRVLILAPLSGPSLDDEVDGLRAAARVELIAADPQALAAFRLGPRDPASRVTAAQAGVAHGRQVAPVVAALWEP